MVGMQPVTPPATRPTRVGASALPAESHADASAAAAQMLENAKSVDRPLPAEPQAPHLASASVISPPRWTADGRWLVFTTCLQNGRRIVAVDTDRGAALDLSQPGWDAWAALLPESGDLLLHNGRGGLWRSRLKVPLAAP